MERDDEDEETIQSNESSFSFLDNNTRQEIVEENSMEPNLKASSPDLVRGSKGKSTQEIEEENLNADFSHMRSNNDRKTVQMDGPSSSGFGNSKHQESVMENLNENYLDADSYNLV